MLLEIKIFDVIDRKIASTRGNQLNKAIDTRQLSRTNFLIRSGECMEFSIVVSEANDIHFRYNLKRTCSNDSM